MNHTQRIAYVARQKRYLTKSIVKEAVELYLEQLANDIAQRNWVDIKGIGKIQVCKEEADYFLTAYSKDNKRVKRHINQRLRSKIRLYSKFKEQCKLK